MTTLDHFSIDLETLDNRYSSAVLSIGVQQFDPNTGKLGATFYREIDIDSAIKAGTVSGSRLAWWMMQDAKAKRLFEHSNKKVGVATALDELRTWMSGLSPVPKVWGNGAGFDITILEHAHDKGCVGLTPAWHFTSIRDMRTIVEDAQLGGMEWPEREGVHHNALDDAIYQAQVISYCRMKINKALAGTSASKPKKAVKTPVATTVPEDDEL